ncbi:MAG: hypothetical protein PVF15_07895 [Candidatus Bathyarchaeota archaeon]
MTNKMVCALLSGKAETRKKARYLAERYANCPYVSLIATKENMLFATYFLPERQRWWIETIEKKPKETIGLENAKVIFLEDVFYPEQMKMQLPDEPQKISPCKSTCEVCPYYEKCSGCPATTFYKDTT